MPRFSRSCAVSAALVAAALAGAAPALGNPDDPGLPPPPPPALDGLIPSAAGIGSVLAQNGSAPAGPFGLPDLSAYGPGLLLGQNAVPAAPGDAAAVAIPNINPLVSDYLLPLNTEPAAPGEGTPAPGIGPDADIPGTGRIAFLRRLNEMYQAGLLKGALLGQQSPEEFDQPAPVEPPAG